MLEFARPWILTVLPAVGIWALWIASARRPPLAQFLAGGDGTEKTGPTRVPASLLFRSGVVGLLVLALAGPRTRDSRPLPPGEGLAMMIALDLSGSMVQEDEGGRSRLDMARDEIARFIRARSQDRIGLVTFGESAVTRVPPTTSHQHLLEVLESLSVGSPVEGTALGMGLGLAAHGTLNVHSPSRIVILLTDGRNNRGQVEPLSAAEAAGALGVRIHAVGVGEPFGEDPLDEPLLKRIVETCGGQYFKVEDARGLREVLAALGELETGPVGETAGFSYESRHMGILILALLLLSLEAVFRFLPGGRVS